MLLILNKNSLQWILNEIKALTRDLLKADEQLFSFPPFLVEGFKLYINQKGKQNKMGN